MSAQSESSSNFRQVLSLAVILLLASVATRADQRGVVPGAAGANRLDPDPVLLSRGRPLQYSAANVALGGLDDLRLKDRSGHEVPYLLVAPRDARERWLTARVLAVKPTKTTSGFEADLGAVQTVDRIRIEGLSAPAMKRLALEGSGDRSHYTLLAQQATVFDLPAEKLRHLDVDFEPGAYRYLRVTWDDRSSAVVRDAVGLSARLHAADAPQENLRVAVPFQASAAEPGKSHYRLQLPGPHLPIRSVEIVCSNEYVLRNAVISESRLNGSELVPAALGSSTLRKSSRDGVSAANLSIPISFPETADIDLAVEDGDNPALSIERIEARFAPLPWIYFETPDGQPLTASFGNASLAAPHYDIEALRNSVSRVTVAQAKWAPAITQSQPPSAGSELAFRGATVKRQDFRYRRALTTSPKGVARLLLDADVLAHSSEMSDVRIVDPSNVQVPFIVERVADPLALEVRVPERRDADGRSVYRFILPYDNLPANTRLVIRTSAPVFSRNVELRSVGDESVRDGRWPTLATASWSSSDPVHEPPPLTLQLPTRSAKTLDLLIDEGDNAPLPLKSARLLVPTVALRFWHPGTALTLLSGNLNAAPPRYDIELLAARLLAAPAREVTLASFAAVESGAAKEMKWFWVVVVAVTAALFVVLARLIGGREKAAAQQTASARRDTT